MSDGESPSILHDGARASAGPMPMLIGAAVFAALLL